VTESALIELIRASLPQCGGSGHSVQELVELSGTHTGAVRAEIGRLIKAGKVVCERGKRMGIDGVMRHVPLYRTVEE